LASVFTNAVIITEQPAPLTDVLIGGSLLGLYKFNELAEQPTPLADAHSDWWSLPNFV
jgi:hypothetical protein